MPATNCYYVIDGNIINTYEGLISRGPVFKDRLNVNQNIIGIRIFNLWPIINSPNFPNTAYTVIGHESICTFNYYKSRDGVIYIVKLNYCNSCSIWKVPTSNLAEWLNLE